MVRIRWGSSSLSTVLVGAIAGLASGQDLFSNAGTVGEVGPECMGIGFDGSDWLIASVAENSWRRFDQAFAPLGTTTVPGAAGDRFRALAFDEGSGKMFVAAFLGTNRVYEVAPDGTVVQSFVPPVTVNAIAINQTNGTLWLVSFFQGAYQVTRTGIPIRFIDPDGLWTGAAYDEVRGTLLLLESTTDLVHEFSRFGEHLGVVVDTDAVQDNGLGLHYDSMAGVLHVTSQSGSVESWQRAGCGITFDFETEDDFVTPLVNGQDISTPPEFGNFVALSGEGPNAGAAIFDSTPGGPNEGNYDADLLVDCGNILILQHGNFNQQTTSGIFNFPNDASAGGTLRFDFLQPITPTSIVLIDIDSGATDVEVVLTDELGARRVYDVPPRWTGDLVEDGFGKGELDLTTSTPQPGLGSVATATEDASFDPGSVVLVEVHLGSSGAVDDLTWCAGAGPPAPPGKRPQVPVPFRGR